MSGAIKWYQAQLARSPIATQLISTGILFGAGDVLAQQAVERKGLQHDLLRTGRMTFFGTAIAGPILVGWYRVLDRHVNLSSPTKTLLARVAADQLAFAPVNIAVFFSAQGVLEGKSPSEISNKLSTAWAPTLVANWKLWPAVQLVNFKFVPLEHRLLVVNLVALGWNCVLSAINAGNVAVEEKIIQVD
ncbi:Protein required for ethanol metabolism [Savitreella phatthalungensis]